MVFPDPTTFDFDHILEFRGRAYWASDIIAFGIEPTIENLIEAYSKGIFPWPTDSIPLPWYCPEYRAILDFAELRIPRSLAKIRRREPFKFTIDKDFESVIKNCASANRSGQDGTWINEEVIERYVEFHRLGHAHSIEAWNANGDLVGGLYGVDAGGVFCGESMFHREPNASKLALLFLIDHLNERGSTWLDCQVMTPHMEALGAVEISRGDFLYELKKIQELDPFIF